MALSIVANGIFSSINVNLMLCTLLSWCLLRTLVTHAPKPIVKNL
jgi:hypothetical protein